MQDKIIGIVIFLAVGILMTVVGAGEGADAVGTAYGALANSDLWASAIVALTVAGIAMGVWSNGGLSGVDIRSAVLMLILAAMISGDFKWDSWGACLATAWIVTGGGLLNKN